MVTSSSSLAISCATSPKTREFGKSYRKYFNKIGPICRIGPISAANTVFSPSDENQTDRIVYQSGIVSGDSVCFGGGLALDRGVGVLDHLSTDVLLDPPVPLFLRSGPAQRALRLAHPTEPEELGQSPPLTLLC